MLQSRLGATLGVLLFVCSAGVLGQAAKPASPPPAQAAAATTPPAHPVTAQQVAKLMEVTHATTRMRDGMRQMIQQQQKAMPPIFPAGFWTDLESELNGIDWVAVATPIYQKHLSEEDAQKALAFYQTDAGQRSLESGFAVMQEMSQKGFELGRAAGEHVSQKYSAEIQENAKKLQEKQQAAPAGNEPKK